MTDLSTAVLNVLWDDGEFVLSRAVRGEQLPPLLMMAPTSSRPAPDTVARLEHAYALRDELDPTWTAPAAASPDGGSLKQVERSHIRTVLRQTNWRIDRAQGAARILKLHPNTLRSRMQRLGIRRTAHEGE